MIYVSQHLQGTRLNRLKYISVLFMQNSKTKKNQLLLLQILRAVLLSTTTWEWNPGPCKRNSLPLSHTPRPQQLSWDYRMRVTRRRHKSILTQWQFTALYWWVCFSVYMSYVKRTYWFVFLNKLSSCSPGFSRTCYVLKLTENLQSSASAFLVLEL